MLKNRSIHILEVKGQLTAVTFESACCDSLGGTADDDLDSDVILTLK